MDVNDILLRQEGLISRAQVLQRGGDDNDIERMLRRRAWARAHPGVYVVHTGPLSLSEREWAAVLYAGPAALTGFSALRRHGVRTGSDRSERPDVVEIAIDHRRTVAPRPGIRITRTRGFAHRVQERLSPPRLRLEEVVLDVAAASTTVGAVALLSDACRSRRTTPERLLRALDGRTRMRQRALLRAVLADVASGAHSVLEWKYLCDVERPHGLTTGRRQRGSRSGGAMIYRDVVYEEAATIVELDGRLGHELATDRWTDLARDVNAATDGAITVRLGWSQVTDACATASALARILQARGWPGAPRACSARCPVGQRVDPAAPRAGRSTR